MARITNPRTIASRDIFTEEEEEEEQDKQMFADTSPHLSQDDSDFEEEIPEAFIPNFTVAPEEIPPASNGLPTEEEQKSTLNNLYKKLGVKIDQLKNAPVEPMTPEKDKFVRSSSHMIALVLSSVMTWVFSVSGVEYGVLAPSEEEAERIVTPFMRIYARHSKLVSTISPDYEDAVEGLTAISGYISVSMQMLQIIREDKAKNDGRISKAQVRPSFKSARQDDIRGYTATGNEHVENNGSTDAVDTSNLTDEQRYNRDMLRQLTERDIQYRARRSGRF